MNLSCEKIISENEKLKLTDLEKHIKRERLIDWINQMDEVGLDELIEEYL